MQIEPLEVVRDRIDTRSSTKTVPINLATQFVVSQHPRTIGKVGKKQRRDREKRRVALIARKEMAHQIEHNLKRLCRICLNEGVMFRRKEKGQRYCCLFLEGSRYRHICSYLSQNMVHVQSWGCDLMRHECMNPEVWAGEPAPSKLTKPA